MAPSHGRPLSGDGLPTLELGERFGIEGQLIDVRRLGGGHIHTTYLATYGDDPGPAVRYVHQRLNTSVFADVEALMGNFVRVTTHLAARTRPPRRPVVLRPATDGRPFTLDDAGVPWRTLEFVDGARTFPRFETGAHAFEGAVLAAEFVAGLADLAPPPPEVIPGFHDVARRLGALEEARGADVAGRAADCDALVDAVLGHRRVALDVAEARAEGRLPERTVHNDTKTDNLLFDAATGTGLCLVDLDTVGPGTVLFDVGDLVRSGATALPEDGDPYALTVDHDLVAAVLEGYAAAGAGFLTPSEVELLPLAGPLMALESAARFLTDYLQGDVYFPVEGPGHNLRRARNQLRLFELLLAG
ncbi:MAG: aminoglycoside phosphotransferase family protein [Actinomycetota bacterium]|nr:aminoglycoside phosphotransferase family protein [Actinomycetota bacterium]